MEARVDKSRSYLLPHLTKIFYYYRENLEGAVYMISDHFKVSVWMTEH